MKCQVLFSLKINLKKNRMSFAEIVLSALKVKTYFFKLNI